MHAALMEQPRMVVDAQRLAAISDEDARENYRIVLNFRDQLLAAPSLEAFYAELFLRDVAAAALHRSDAQVILRGILDGEDDGLKARARIVFPAATRERRKRRDPACR